MAPGKKHIVRLVLFLLALAFAVGSFTFGVMSFVHRESGWYEVNPTVEAAAVTYSSGIHLLYHVEGGSSAIRQELNAVQKAYSEILLRCHKMLDAKNEYDDVVSIAAIAAAEGEPVVIGEALYGVLCDALAKTDENLGYSMFDGALWREWETLLYLDEPAGFDPANNADEAERMAALAGAAGRRALFELTLSPEDGYTAAFSTAQAYREIEAEWEIDAPALDLNVLREAYLLQLTAREMTRQGLTKGYLYADSGLTALMDCENVFHFDLFGWADGTPTGIGSLAANGPTVFCQFTAFSPAEEKYGRYAVETAKDTLLRHPLFDARTGGFHDVLMSAVLASDTRDAVDLAYEVIVLNALDSRGAVEARLAAADADTAAVWTWQDDTPKAVHMNAAAAACVTAQEGTAVVIH